MSRKTVMRTLMLLLLCTDNFENLKYAYFPCRYLSQEQCLKATPAAKINLNNPKSPIVIADM